MEATHEDEWQPILAGDDAELAWRVIHEIAVALRGPAPKGPFSASGLACGAAGVAMFYRELDLQCPGEGFDGDLIRCLDDAAECEDKRIVLFNGTPGVAWVTEQILGKWDGEPDVYDELDDLIAARAPDWPLTDYDLISGIAGIGVYTLARLPRPQARANLTHIVHRLAAAATRGPDGAAWFTTPEQAVTQTARFATPHARAVGFYNLGVAHGSAGVLAFLGTVCASSHASDVARQLLSEGMEWLLARKDPDVGYGALFCVGEPPVRCQSAWCYGNPGVAVAMMVAGRGASRSDWVEAGTDLLSLEATRPVEDCGVVEPGLCHGSLGLAHAYNRAFQVTRRRQFAESARRWALHALHKQRKPGQGVAGFSIYGGVVPGTDDLIWNNDHSFLTGAAGIGLGLLGLLTRPQGAWDQALLLAIPPGP